jgi:MoaD family protein
MVIRVIVKTFSYLRSFFGERVVIELEKTITLKDLLNVLVEKYGVHAKSLIYDENGNVHGFLLLIVNGKPVTSPEDFNINLENGSTILIMPVAPGG